MTKQCSDISSLSISSHSDPEQGKEEEKSKTSEPSASPTSFSASNGNGHRNGHKHGHKTEPIIPTPDELKLVETLRGRWNEIPGVVLCPSLDGTLLRRVTQLVREKPERWWMIFFEQVSNSNFLRGGVRSREDKRPMRVDLAWAMNPDHLGDIMSGRYDQAYDRQPRQLTGRSPM